MGCFFSVSGVIPLGRELTKEEMEELEEKLGVYPGDTCELHGEGALLRVEISGGMSYSSACAIEDALQHFALRYASAGAVLHTKCDDESQLLIVGPTEAARVKAELDYLVAQLEDLRQQVNAVRARLYQLTMG